MLYTTTQPEDKSNYLEVKVDNKIFYCEKAKKEVNGTPKKRYSNQFKDPLFVAKDTYRELNMISQFRKKYTDFNSVIKKYKECIENCIVILDKEYKLPPVYIFQSFKLEDLGINPEDYGVEIEEKQSGVNECE